jgi:2-isopropylmalate synthase
MDSILLYDTTLRDGTQGENVTFSADEKLNIAMRLDDIGMHYIEGGWPGSNPRDVAFFNLAKRISFKHSRLAAFGSTRKPGCARIEMKISMPFWKPRLRPSRYLVKAGICM